MDQLAAEKNQEKYSQDQKRWKASHASTRSNPKYKKITADTATIQGLGEGEKQKKINPP